MRLGVLRALILATSLLTSNTVISASYGGYGACGLTAIEAVLRVELAKESLSKAQKKEVEKVKKLVSDQDALLSLADKTARETLEAYNPEINSPQRKVLFKWLVANTIGWLPFFKNRYGLAYGTAVFAVYAIGEIAIPVLPGTGFIPSLPLIVGAEIYLYVRGKIKAKDLKLLSKETIEELDQMLEEATEASASLALVKTSKENNDGIPLLDGRKIYEDVRIMQIKIYLQSIEDLIAQPAKT